MIAVICTATGIRHLLVNVFFQRYNWAKRVIDMDKNSKQMLKYLTDKKCNPDGYMLFDDFYENYEEFSGLEEHETMACMRYLVDNGYISYCQNQDESNVGFELEHKAYHKKYFQWVSVKRFLIKSVLIPIAVSILTTLVIALLKDSLLH